MRVSCVSMPWIETVAPEDAQGRLAEAYQWQARKLGRPTEFTQLGSLDAEVVNARLVLYRASENVPSALSAEQRTMISYLVSVLNATPHCASLARPYLPPDMVAALDASDFSRLAPADAALARYVAKLTLHVGEMCADDVAALRRAGFSDLDILDANNQCAHLNYTNRVANGLGLLTEAVTEERTPDRVPG
jgi:uncharacterized peroxidase-related enzyme